MITLKTLPQATAREVFEQVKEHLLRQGKRSEEEPDKCLYRFGGLSCAAGCLIGDSEYNEAMEGENWRWLINRGYVPDVHKYLIASLQRIHDKYPVDQWPEALNTLESHLTDYE